MDVWTKFEEGQGVLELLIGNEKVRRTDRQTGAKQNVRSSSKGGIKTSVKITCDDLAYLRVGLN